MTNEHFAYLDELKIQLPAMKFIKSSKLALSKYFEQDDNFDRFVENVRLLMHLNNLSVETLSEKAGFNRSYIGRLLRKEMTHRNISTDSVRKIAETLNVKPSFLIRTDIKKMFRQSLVGTM